MVARSVELIRPQAEFLSMPHKFRAYVAGYRAGKTWAGSSSLCGHAWEFPRVPLAYYAPTFPLIRDIFYPTIERVAHDWGITCDIKEANKEVHLHSGRTYLTTIICRSMENPHKIIGFQVGSAMVDEIDTMPMKKADQAWVKIIARNSYTFEGINRIDVTTTPEGFSFTYNRFKKSLQDNPDLAGLYGLVQASTYENEINLPDDYIPSLIDSYPAQLIEAYLHGKFVNLTHGSVYKEFSRGLNGSTETIDNSEPLFIGMDFNVGKMSGAVFVKRDGLPHLVEEIINAYDTPDIVRTIQERYWKYENGQFHKTHQINIFPDSSGASRKSVGASMTDIALLKLAGFRVIAPPANPPVKDRVNSLNAMIRSADGLRRFRVNVDKCPVMTESIEKQAYNDKGEPDKLSGYDNPNDAIGYYIHRDYPLMKPLVKLDLNRAM